ncbi:hypothetical protein SAMN02927921_00117 [Sinomicrobium oceani]|uniref:Uncharacterized protein n=1 Tax=Sinomicrobium oceani TaxID=1150368 RepID=A0A1K1LNF8_9FLAO|nr:hypothetical protein SAMN02927921_00117 [Sinomicrobium oceani]
MNAPTSVGVFLFVDMPSLFEQ